MQITNEVVVPVTSAFLIKRSGDIVPFTKDKIRTAIIKAFLKDADGHALLTEALSQSGREKIDQITDLTVAAVMRSKGLSPHIHIEEVQDQVELQLMRAGEHKVARGYVIYRERRDAQRKLETKPEIIKEKIVMLRDADGTNQEHSVASFASLVASFATGLTAVDAIAVAERAAQDSFEGMPEVDFDRALVYSAREKIEQEPEYSLLASRLQLRILMREVVGFSPEVGELKATYAAYFPTFIAKAIDAELLDERLASFDLPRLAHALHPTRDFQFRYLGFQTLYDRYFLHIEEKRIELPQAFFMRVAMGLALNEKQPNERAIEFYDVLSSFDYMASTPTLFNSGSRRSQLSSCYLSTIPDDLDGIFEGIKENALLSKYAGGLGNDWTPVRALGAHIKGTNGKSQGIVPFLKVVNDTAVAVNQGGKRKGAVCAYLETWHLDIEEFLEMRKNTGDDRRRTHDMNTANWVPDLFMQRVMKEGTWTLFSPSDVPDLHDLYGQAFEKRYVEYEEKVANGEMRLFKTVRATDLWRKMLSMLFETGHPWITFKDACNIRSPQQHVGVVHSSNLCTEITLNTNAHEIAVCNLGSVNLLAHLHQASDGSMVIDHNKLRRTVTTAMRMLDNVIDLNFYPVKKAGIANLKHRPVGLGVMGFQDALHAMRVPFASDDAVKFADASQEAVCFYAYEASVELAQERGKYESFEGSLWSKGILPQDSLKMLAESRQQGIETLTPIQPSILDWDTLRARIMKWGMRNSNCVAIAPTATISNIIGVSACIEPTYENLFVKSNLSGEFTVINEFMVKDLKAAGLWDAATVADLKYYDGSIAKIERIPSELKALYATAFEVPVIWVLKAAAYRQKWIDQAQSLNIYMAGVSGRALDDIYKTAWTLGLKTTYYLRTKSASSAEKSTGKGGELNAVHAQTPSTDEAPRFCSISDPTCESCQ